MKGFRIVISLLGAALLGLLPVPGEADPGHIVALAGNSTPGYAGDLGAATSASLNSPNSVVVDSNGNLYIADTSNHRVRKVDAGGIITTVAGNGTAGYTGDNGPATDAGLNPMAVAVDSAGNLYIADMNNHAIRKVSGGIITTVAGKGTPTPTGVDPGDGGAAIAATLKNPSGVAVDSDMNIYIADQSNKRIRKVTFATGFISTVAGNGTSGSAGDGGLATAANLFLPSGVAVDGARNLYIADQFNHKIRKVTAATGLISTVAGNGAAGTGNGTYSGDGGLATSAGLGLPNSVIVDSAGNLYIADTFNYRIRKVSGGIITTVAGDGTLGFSSEDLPATATSLQYPKGVAIDSAGNLFIADGSHRILRVIESIVPVVTASPNGGTFAVPKSVTLAASKAATIYYTTDNSDPTFATSSQHSFPTPGQVIITDTTAPTTLMYYAVDSDGNASDVVTSLPFTILPPTAPGAPVGVSVTAGDGHATVSFTAPASDGGSAITLYTVTYTPGNLTVTGNASPITVSELTNGIAYTFSVTATNDIGTGPASNPLVTATPVAPTVPGAPTAVSATAGNAQATIFFSAPASNGGSAITGYTVSSVADGITVNGSTSPITVTGLVNGHVYTFSVTATNAAGIGAAATASVTPIQKAGDCNGIGGVTIDEVQSAINMFLGMKAVSGCVDLNNSTTVTIDEVQKVINAFLGM